MSGKPAARITDPVVHPLPPVLTGGPPASTVLIGMLPAWKGIPPAMGPALQAAQKASEAILQTAETTAQTAEAAAVAAAGTPGAPAAAAAAATARTAAETAKSAAATAMGSAISAAAAGGASIHACTTPWPIPPHGPGVVIDGSPTVSIEMMAATRMGDTIIEAIGPPNKIAMGCPTVVIGNSGSGGGPGGGGALGALIGAAVGAAVGALLGGPAGAVVGAAAGAAIGGALGGEDRPRPVFGQEEPMSCGQASSRMVIATMTGQDVPESQLRNESQNYPNSYDPVNGTGMGNLTPVLRDHGVNASEPQSGQTVDDLQAATANGHPAIAHIAYPGGGGHFVVIDGVRTNPDGTRTVIMRDPAPQGQGTQREMSESDFTGGGYPGNGSFSGWTITT